MEFDSHDSWKEVVLEGLMQMERSRKRCRAGDRQTYSSLTNLSMVNPSWTAKEYNALWSCLFSGTNNYAYGNLECFSASVCLAYDVLRLKKPCFASTEGSSESSELRHLQPLLQKAMQPTLSNLLEAWRERPPPIYCREFLLSSHDNAYVSGDFRSVEEVWNLYRSIAIWQQAEQAKQGIMHGREAKANDMNDIKAVLDLLWKQPFQMKQTYRDKDDVLCLSLDCIYHFVSYFGPILF